MSLKSNLLERIYEGVNFICYGDLPTSFYIKHGMKVGKNFYRQSATKFDPSHCFLIEIGNDVTIANQVLILAHDQSPRVHLGIGKVGRVIIGNNVFVGAKSILMPNVTIGDNVIIGAGSVVTKSFPSGVVIAGVPAKVVGTTKDYVEKCKKEAKRRKVMSTKYANVKSLSSFKKRKLQQACKDGPVYINLGKVIEYGRRIK